LQYFGKAPTTKKEDKIEKKGGGKAAEGEEENVWDRAPAFLQDEEDEG
jgi:hypothetical protein